MNIEEEEKVKCPNCGTENEDHARVCKVCGESLLDPMDDSFSWADTVDVWNGVEGLPEESPEQLEETPKKKRRQKESVEDHLNEDEEEPYLVQEPSPDQDEDEEDDGDDEGIGKGSVHKAVLFILIGCLAVVLIIMLIVAFRLIRNDKNPETVNGTVTSSPTISSIAESSRETLETTTGESASTTEETTENTTEDTTEETTEDTTEKTTQDTTEESTSTTQATTPSESVQDSVVVQNGMSYQIQNGTATLTDAKSVGGAVAIPQQINGAPVQFIADGAFQGNTAVSRIVIPEGVITVGTNAFYGCSSLTEVVVPDSVRLIGEGAFNYCPTFVIYCNPGTYAEEFCNRWNVESRPMN